MFFVASVSARASSIKKEQQLWPAPGSQSGLTYQGAEQWRSVVFSYSVWTTHAAITILSLAVLGLLDVLVDPATRLVKVFVQRQDEIRAFRCQTEIFDRSIEIHLRGVKGHRANRIIAEEEGHEAATDRPSKV